MKNIDNLKSGDILSETSHYKVESIYGDKVNLRHYESGECVAIEKPYIHKFINSGDEYEEVIEVTKEDKKDGTPGIRTIFENIHNGQVFTVCFTKQDKIKSKKAVEEAMNKRTEKFLMAINKAKASKTSITKVAEEYFKDLMLNPILEVEKGENRILRGFKIQFDSRDGKYNCIDMDIKKSYNESCIRQVNINTIVYLIYNGIKYVVK